MSVSHADEQAPATTALSYYMKRRNWLIAEGFMPDRKPGRPRIYEPDEALRVIKRQKRESYQRTQQHIREEQARRAHP